ncbi:unnamed protein product [Cuscuta campestris]|uniref:Uncharacterized protein n=1 Tax=Cuscuta campestris TaxID=132261 RepID=A0A484L3D8_9ASTE|nr:unnamed protein product [Cuscuta campestris]
MRNRPINPAWRLICRRYQLGAAAGCGDGDGRRRQWRSGSSTAMSSDWRCCNRRKQRRRWRLGVAGQRLASGDGKVAIGWCGEAGEGDGGSNWTATRGGGGFGALHLVLNELGITELICHPTGHPTVHSSTPESHLLLYIVSWIIKPQKYGHTIMSGEDLKLLHAISHSAPINWAKFVMIYMTDATSTTHNHLLPYPLLVMDITIGPHTKDTKIWMISAQTFTKRSDNAAPTSAARRCTADGLAEPQARANLASISDSLNRLNFKVDGMGGYLERLDEAVQRQGGAPTIHSAPLEKRLLLYILTRKLRPRDGSHTSLFNEDLKAIPAIMHGASINWAKFVMIHMADCASLATERSLPYAFLVMDLIVSADIHIAGPSTKMTKLWVIADNTFQKKSKIRDDARPSRAPAPAPTRASLQFIADTLNRLTLTVDGMGQYMEQMDWTLQRQHLDMTAFFRGINYIPPPFDSTILGQNFEGGDEDDDSYAPSSSPAEEDFEDVVDGDPMDVKEDDDEDADS